MSKIDEVKANVEKGKTKLIEGLVQEALSEGNFAADIGADAYTPDAGAAAIKAKELVAA